jgi:rfaE bifunctional protein nucleotidyltransferase chain/domain
MNHEQVADGFCGFGHFEIHPIRGGGAGPHDVGKTEHHASIQRKRLDQSHSKDCGRYNLEPEPRTPHEAMLSWLDRMIASTPAVAKEVRALQANGKKVVFTNGCFDILHSGHIDLLRRARGLGDALVVAINSDASVGRMKGLGRPILPQEERAELVDAMEMVDFVCIFDEDTPRETILQIHPDVLVKGADWTANIVGQTEVEGWGGKVVALPLVEGHSTSAIVERVISRYGGNSGTVA